MVSVLRVTDLKFLSTHVIGRLVTAAFVSVIIVFFSAFDTKGLPSTSELVALSQLTARTKHP